MNRRNIVLGLSTLLALLGCGKSTETPTVDPSQASASAGVRAGPSAEPAEPRPPADDDRIAFVGEVASKAAVRGFHVSGVRGHGWSRSGPEGDVLARLSGPPGGPLGFEVRSYRGGASEPTLDALFRSVVKADPITAGPKEKLRIAGAERDAQAFRTGASLATAVHCAVAIPGDAGRAGLLILFDSGALETTEPRCEHPLGHPALKPLVDSFALE